MQHKKFSFISLLLFIFPIYVFAAPAIHSATNKKPTIMYTVGLYFNEDNGCWFIHSHKPKSNHKDSGYCQIEGKDVYLNEHDFEIKKLSPSHVEYKIPIINPDCRVEATTINGRRGGELKGWHQNCVDTITKENLSGYLHLYTRITSDNSQSLSK